MRVINKLTIREHLASVLEGMVSGKTYGVAKTLVDRHERVYVQCLAQTRGGPNSVKEMAIFVESGSDAADYMIWSGTVAWREAE